MCVCVERETCRDDFGSGGGGGSMGTTTQP